MKRQNITMTKSTRLPHVLFTVAALALTACTPAHTEWTETESPKTIDVQRLAASLNVTVNGEALNVAQTEQLDSFLSRQGNLFNLRVTLASQANDSLGTVQKYLIDRGVRPSHISHAAASSSVAGNVEIVAEHYVSAPPSCPDWSHSNLLDNANSNSSNFGCSTASNLARMVADPRDLVVGRSLAPAAGTAAGAAVGRYNAGEIAPLPTFRYSSTTE